jgi:hypothetical protein
MRALLYQQPGSACAVTVNSCVLIVVILDLAQITGELLLPKPTVLRVVGPNSAMAQPALSQIA